TRRAWPVSRRCSPPNGAVAAKAASSRPNQPATATAQCVAAGGRVRSVCGSVCGRRYGRLARNSSSRPNQAAREVRDAANLLASYGSYVTAFETGRDEQQAV